MPGIPFSWNGSASVKEHAEAGKTSHVNPRILIGILNRPLRGSIPTVTQAFIEGLGQAYDFRPFYNNRTLGVTRGAKFNPLNLLYTGGHIVRWVLHLLIDRPAIVHYPITSGWNLEKSLMLLRLARLAGVRTVGHLHGGSFDAFWERNRGLRKRMAARELCRLDAFVVLSEGWKQWAVEKIGVAPDRVMVVNNPIDRAFEEQAVAQPVPGPATVFFIGALGRRKGCLDVVKAAALLQREGRELPFLIAGPEEEPGARQRVEQMISEEGLRTVSVLGPVYGREKADLFAAGGVFVFPSYAENLPLVILEAAAAGRAIVTTSVGAIPEFFEHDRSVVFVRPGDHEAIARSVSRLVNSREECKRLGLAAREVFRTGFAREHVMHAMDNVYRKVLGSHE